MLRGVKYGWEAPEPGRGSSQYAALRRLVKRGSVKWAIDPACGRRKLWTLTDKGKEELEAAQSRYATKD